MQTDQLDTLFIENLVIDPRYRRGSATDTFAIHLICQIPSGSYTRIN